MRHNQIFTPNDHPTVTYVNRDNRKLEEKLRDHLETANIVVSISGATKTGKTVLLRQVVHSDTLIPITGASIKSIEDFWSSILSWMEVPTNTISTTGNEIGAALKGSASVEGSIFVAKGKGETAAEGNYKRIVSISTTHAEDPFSQVVREVGGSDFVIFLDDFHYIKKDVQEEIAKAIKGLAENGVKFCVASVPHRSEDVLGANSELRGRLVTLTVPEWTEDELRVIGQKGFKELNVVLSPSVYRRLASEAFRSPQLMQALCLNLCRIIGVRETLDNQISVEVSEDDYSELFRDTSEFASFGQLVEILHGGPKVHGTERKTFSFSDGSTGDVYRALLLALRENPPAQTFSYDEILARVRSVCTDETPVGSSISSSLMQMVILANKHSGDLSVLDWDENYLTIIDPYFSFYLRGSDKISQIKT